MWSTATQYCDKLCHTLTFLMSTSFEAISAFNVCSIHVDQTYRIFGRSLHSLQFLHKVILRLFLELMCRIYMPFTRTEYLDELHTSDIFFLNLFAGYISNISVEYMS